MVRRTSLFYWDATGGASHLDRHFGRVGVPAGLDRGRTWWRKPTRIAPWWPGTVPDHRRSGSPPLIELVETPPTVVELVETLVGTPESKGFDKLNPQASTSSTNGEWWKRLVAPEGTPQALEAPVASPVRSRTPEPPPVAELSRPALNVQSSGRPVQVAIVAPESRSRAADAPPCIWRTPRPASSTGTAELVRCQIPTSTTPASTNAGNIGVGHLHILPARPRRELGQGQRCGRTTRCRWPPGPGRRAPGAAQHHQLPRVVVGAGRQPALRDESRLPGAHQPVEGARGDHGQVVVAASDQIQALVAAGQVAQRGRHTEASEFVTDGGLQRVDLDRARPGQQDPCTRR